MDEIMKMVRAKVAERLADRGPIPVWTAMEHALIRNETITLTAAQMHEALADNAYLILAKNELCRENLELREQLTAEELRRT